MTRTGKQGGGGSRGRDKGACEITGGKVSPGAQLHVAGVWPAEGEGYSGLFLTSRKGDKAEDLHTKKEVLRVQCERSATTIPRPFLVNTGLFSPKRGGQTKPHQ